MRNFRNQFSQEVKQSILLLWNINNSEECVKVDLGLPNFFDVIHENKKPKLEYTINLKNGSKVEQKDLKDSFKSYVNYLSTKTLECLSNKNKS
tara:strand:- start:6067 stop:6345 length:279 start_codon:yes stop_codon:yes gene_type:complete